MSHIALAELAAEESMVLLKNNNNTLPINKTTVKKIAVIGANLIYGLQETNSQDKCTMCGTSTSSTCPIANGIGCTMDLTTNVRTGDNGSSRVFSDPSKSVGPTGWDPGRRWRHHRDRL